jgi:hypothetical protein
MKSEKIKNMQNEMNRLLIEKKTKVALDKADKALEKLLEIEQILKIRRYG